MKKLIYLFAIGIALTTGLGRAAYEEGRHYYELPFSQPVETGSKIEVREFFWYGCPHCYTLEPVLASWLKRIPANARFVRTPGVAPRWLVHAQAFYTIESLGATEKLHRAFFDAIHKQNRRLNTEDSVARFVAEHGVDQKKFRQAFNSFGVRLKLKKAIWLNRNFGINSVPALVVDGKYLTSPTIAGGNKAAMKVVDYLIDKAARERRREKKKEKREK